MILISVYVILLKKNRNLDLIFILLLIQQYHSLDFKMNVKTIVKKLEKHIEKNHLHYNAKFFSNRRNNYIHLELDKSLFSYENYNVFLRDIDSYLSANLNTNFEIVDPPKLVLSLRWKHDYIVRRRTVGKS